VTKEELYSNYREGAFSSRRLPQELPSGFQEQLFSPPEPLPGLEGVAPLQGSGVNEDVVLAVGAETDVKIWQLHNKYLICQIKTGTDDN